MEMSITDDLYWFICSNRTYAAIKIIEKHDSIHELYITPACHVNNNLILKKILEKKIVYYKFNESGRCKGPLCYCIENGNLEGVVMLLESGFTNIDDKIWSNLSCSDLLLCPIEKYPIELAIEHNRKDIFYELMKRNPKNTSYILSKAIRSDSEEISIFLINKGYDNYPLYVPHFIDLNLGYSLDSKLKKMHQTNIRGCSIVIASLHSLQSGDWLNMF